MNDRIGERFTTNEGYEIIIIDYKDTDHVMIQFQDEYKTIIPRTTYSNCRKGSIKNPYHPSVFGIGYLGVGKYIASINKKPTKEYLEWKEMLERGFNDKYKIKKPTYKNVTVAKDFYCFQDYGAWREDNYYEVKDERMCLDKDILIKGNNIYSPDTCIFVPERINTLFIKSDAIRGDCPIGVTYRKDTNKYVAQCSIKTKEGSKNKRLGSYNTPEEAFKVYKEFKEEYIKQVADEYKYYIPKELYEAMYKWEVEITD